MTRTGIMNIRPLFPYCGPALAVLLVFPGCASTPTPAGSDRQFDAEISMVQEQSEQIIAEVQSNPRGEDRIIPNDELTVEVWMRDQKTQFAGFPLNRTVPGSGGVFIPHIGLTTVTGKTDNEVKVLLSEYFDKILNDATVVVEHSRKRIEGQPVQGISYVSLLGWVQKPGLYELEPGVTTLRDVIATAGDMKEFADTKGVYLVRGPVDDPEVIKINFARVRVGRNLAQNYVLHHNDAIYVPPVRMWNVYDFIRIVLLPITAVRDAVGFFLPYSF